MELRGVFAAAAAAMAIASFGVPGQLAYWANDSSPFCQSLKGKSLVSDDWKFLGTFDDKYNSDSIFNKYGTYGSKYNSDSIFNKYGTYGSKYNSDSPWNKYSTTGPKIEDDTHYYWRLTINKYVSDHVDPFAALYCFMEPGDDRMEPFLELNQNASSVSYSPLPSSTVSGSSCGLHSVATTLNGDCKCIAWYQWKNPNDPKNFDCVPKASADALCVIKYWWLAKSDWTWIAADGKYFCECTTGYSWNASRTACVLNKTPDQSCKESFGQHSKSNGGNNCSCESGYEWNASQTACVPSKTPDQSCQTSFWRFSKSDGTTTVDGRYNCACISGYEWNTRMSSCIKTDLNKACKASYWRNAKGAGLNWCLCSNGYVFTSNNSYCVTPYAKNRWNKKFIQLKSASNKVHLSERVIFFQKTASNIKRILEGAKTSDSTRQVLAETVALVEFELERLKGGQAQ